MTSGPNDRPNSGPSHKIGLPIYNRTECYSLITEVDFCLWLSQNKPDRFTFGPYINTELFTALKGMNFHYILELIDVISQYFF